ncbi:MAG: hypothetical protein M0Z36_05775 [Thermaerobacter sp.]|nr:hypothetical protein [Thermaerobacter sp.]
MAVKLSTVLAGDLHVHARGLEVPEQGPAAAMDRRGAPERLGPQ